MIATPALRRDSDELSKYRPDIDGLRAVAIVAVVAYHAFPSALPGGFTGVDIFFVISGYLISQIIWKGIEDRNFSFRGFYRRRIIRLFPALVVVLAASLVLGYFILLPPDFANLGKEVAAAAVFASNFLYWHETSYFGTQASMMPLTNLWSLAVEEQYYLLYPLILLLVARRRASTGFLLLGLLLASFAININWAQYHASAAFYLLPARFWELAAGGLLAWLHVEAPERARNLVSLAGLALVALAVLGPSPTSEYPGWWALAPVGAALLLIASGPGAIVNRALSWRAIVTIGLISYPLYLWHYPLLVFARWHHGGALPTGTTLVVVAISFGLAYATYRLVELPVRSYVRRSRSKTPRKNPTVPALALGMALVAGVGLVVTANSGFPTRIPLQLRALTTYTDTSAATQWRSGTCFLDPDQTSSAFKSCVEGGTKPLVVIYGDSNAAQWTPTLQEHPNFRLAEFTASLCIPALGYAEPARPYCSEVNSYVARRIASLHPYEVLLASAWSAYPASAINDVANTIDYLRRAGVKRIVLVGQSPYWTSPLPTALYRYGTQHPGQPLPYRMNFDYGRTTMQSASALVTQLAHRTGVPFVQPAKVLCDSDGCITRVGNQLWQLVEFDESHFTKAGTDYVFSKLGSQLVPGIASN